MDTAKHYSILIEHWAGFHVLQGKRVKVSSYYCDIEMRSYGNCIGGQMLMLSVTDNELHCAVVST